jgi:hypothetical protein
MTNTALRTRLEYLEPRLVHIHFVGDFDATEAAAVLDRIEQLVAKEPFFMLECVMTDIKDTTPEARRIVAERLKLLPNRAIAVVGGNFAQRVVAKLVLTATTLFGGGKSIGEFFSDADKARAWLREYEAKRLRDPAS